MNTKIKILSLTFALLLSLPLCAQRDIRQVQINMNQPESLAVFTTTYSRNARTGQPDIQVEQEVYLSSYAVSDESDSWQKETTCQAPFPLNLEDVACLISDIALEAGHNLKGEAEIQVLIDASGKYQSHRIMSVEYSPVVAAAEKQIEQIRFVPAQRNQTAESCWVDMRFIFN